MYSVINYHSTLTLLQDLYKGKYSSIFNFFNAIWGTVVIQLIFNCFEWFEWLKGWELTLKAKLTKNISQLLFCCIPTIMFIWRNKFPLLKPKDEFKNTDKIGQAIASIDLSNFFICIGVGAVIIMVVLIGIALLLLAIKQYNTSGKHTRYFFIRPNSSERRLFSLEIQLSRQRNNIHNLNTVIEEQNKKIAQLENTIKVNNSKHSDSFLALLKHFFCS